MHWLNIAKSYLGVAEIPGPRHNTTIQGWLTKLKAWWSDDETPWCGVFVAAVMQEAGLPYPKEYYRALSWQNIGYKLDRPRVGCIAIFIRQGGGHVGFVVGEDQYGRLLILGGNQGNRVSIAPFDRSRLKACIWPDENKPDSSYLPVEKNEQKSSKNEQ